MEGLPGEADDVIVLDGTGSSADMPRRPAQAGNSAASREATGSAILAALRAVDWSPFVPTGDDGNRAIDDDGDRAIDDDGDSRAALAAK